MKEKGRNKKKKMIGRKGEKFQKWMREREREFVCVCYNVARWNKKIKKKYYLKKRECIIDDLMWVFLQIVYVK